MNEPNEPPTDDPSQKKSLGVIGGLDFNASKTFEGMIANPLPQQAAVPFSVENPGEKRGTMWIDEDLDGLTPEAIVYIRKRAPIALEHQLGGRPAQALVIWQELLPYAPERFSLRMNIAKCLSDCELADEAIAAYEKICNGPLKDERWRGEAQINQAWTEMRAGYLAEGWARLYWRTNSVSMHASYKHFKVPIMQDKDFEPGALWGKSILVWLEQGLGDHIIYGSMLPELINAVGPNGKIGLMTDPRLIKTFLKAFEQIATINVGPLPAGPEIENPKHNHWYLHCGVDWDFQMGFSDLGLIFRNSLDDFPTPKPYLANAVDPELYKIIRQRYLALAQGRPIIGISWASTSARVGIMKSMDLKDLAPMMRSIGKDALWISLQYKPPSDFEAKLGSQLGLMKDNAVSPAGDMDAVFAQIASCDLVITCSNTNAHIAGSLGVATFLLIPKTGAGRIWYWIRQKTMCPWYPNVNYFFQEDGKWYKPVHKVKNLLKKWIERRKAEANI